MFVLSSPMIADLVGDGISIDLRTTDIVAAANFHVDVEGPCPELVDEAAALFARR